MSSRGIEWPTGRHPLLRRLLARAAPYVKFGTVGIAATATHVAVFVLGIEIAGLAPLVANLVAFGVAVLVAFLGHFHWTFRSAARGRARPWAAAALARFVAVALSGLAMNSLVVYLVADALALPYIYAVALMVSVVPLMVFALSKFWAFA